jgi:hypothetical protein
MSMYLRICVLQVYCILANNLFFVGYAGVDYEIVNRQISIIHSYMRRMEVHNVHMVCYIAL